MQASQYYWTNLGEWLIFLTIGSLVYPVGIIFALFNKWNWYYNFMIGLELIPQGS